METSNREPRYGWNFDHSYQNLPPLFYSKLPPEPVSVPMLLIGNRALAEELGLDPSLFEDPQAVESLGGNSVPHGASPIAQAYAGHQFGHFTMLGDGRAILLGEQITPSGSRADIQLKGSGRTPYSRRGDGRAAVGPMVREYIISEAMHRFGIPTTRSLAVVSTGDTVYREYPQRGAVLTRTASSHIRVGTFQFAAYRGGEEAVRTLADYTIQRHYPHCAEADYPYRQLLREVISRQASLLAQWQQIGFIHGVMNTDNMSISGESIDYGPCAFMDSYAASTVFSSIDSYGRYAYGNQPEMALWNLTRFAETLLPLFHPDQSEAIAIAESILAGFDEEFSLSYLSGMRKKLGVVTKEESDRELIADLLTIMEENELDFTGTFRTLYDSDEPAVQTWKERWFARLDRQEIDHSEVRRIMDSVNPVIIPRNHLVEQALAAAARNDDLSLTSRLLEALKNPWEFHEEFADLYEAPKVKNEGYRTFCGT